MASIPVTYNLFLTLLISFTVVVPILFGLLGLLQAKTPRCSPKGVSQMKLKSSDLWKIKKHLDEF